VQMKVEDVEGVHVVTVEGELTNLTSIAFFNSMVEMRTQAGTKIVLDLHGVTYLDSIGAGQLWRTVERAREDGGRAVLAAVPPVVRKTLELVGFSGRVEMTGTVAEAVKSLVG